MKKKIYVWLGIAIVVLLAIVIYQYKNPKAQESITFFPIDPSVTYKTAQTTLTQLNEGAPTILWQENSTIDRKAYLRQDASLLYANGRLIGVLRDWKQNTPVLEQQKQIVVDQSSLFQAITFHHAELHEQNDQIFSSQAMSGDYLYDILTSNNKSNSFKKPQNADENHWKQQLYERTERMLQLAWNKGIRHFSINLNNYQAYPLNQFNEISKGSLPGFTKSETANIVGNLWEGIYKNYLLGIKNANGTIVNPIGSTIPLILTAKDKTHLLVLTETAQGEPILLRQMIAGAD